MSVTEIIDGLIWDVETGECLGPVRSTFKIATKEDAEWVLIKLQTCESEIQAIDKTPSVIAARALIANAESMKKDLERRYASIERRFGPELANWARTQLVGKAKTFKTLFGSVSFRAVPDKIKVADEELAVAWAKVHAPAAIKTTHKFLISEAKDKINMDDALAKKAFVTEKGGESFAIKTGVVEDAEA